MQQEEPLRGRRREGDVVALSFPVRRPRTTLALLGLLVVAAVVVLAAAGLETDNTPGVFMVPGDPVHERFERFRSVFGGGDLLVVGVHRRPLLVPRTLDVLERIERRLRSRAEEVRRRHGREEPLLQSVVGVHSVPLVRELLDAGKPDRVAALPLVSDLFLGFESDRPSLALLSVLVHPEVPGPVLADLVDGIAGVLEEEELQGEGDLTLAGTPAMNVALDRAARSQSRTMFPLLGIVAFLVLSALTRSLVAALLILATTAVTVPVTLALLAAAGHTLNLITLSLPAVLLVLGSAASLHLHRAFVARAPSMSDDRQAAEAARRAVLVPCRLAALTTSIGFFSLALSDVGPIREMGLFAGIGILASFVTATHLLPAAIALGLVPRRGAAASSLRWSRLAGRPRTAVAAAVVLLSAAAVGLLRVRVDTGAMGYLPASHPVVRGYERLQDAGVGLNTLEILVELPDDDALRDDAVLAELARSETRLRSLSGVTGLSSLLDVLALARSELARMKGLDPEQRFLLERFLGARDSGVPQDVERPARDGLALAPMLDVLSGRRAVPGTLPVPEGAVERVRSLIDAHVVERDGATLTRLHLATTAERVQEVRDLAAGVKEETGRLEAAVPGSRVTMTGLGPVLVRLQEHLIRGQLESLALAAALVGVVLLLGLRSPRLGVLGAVPGFTSLLLMYGGMGWAGWQLDVATVMVGAIALGIAVDDTVHVLSAFDHERRRRGAVGRVLRKVGWPVAATSVVCCAGFAVLGTSAFLPMRRFGVVTAAAMLLAVIGNLVLLPSLLVLCGGRPRHAPPAEAAPPSRSR